MSNFEYAGYAYVPALLDESSVHVVSKYLENKIRRKEWTPGVEKKFPTTIYNYYADPLVETFLELLKPKIEEITEKELLPTYSYARVYQPKERLKKHLDRESCEISATVSIAYTQGIHPIYLKTKENLDICVGLSPGDALIYKGCEAEHWRDPVPEGQLVVQFMLHYVDKNGPFAAFEKDHRQGLGYPRVQ